MPRAACDPDADLLASVRAGDQRAAQTLARRLLPPLLALAERMLDDRAEAEDVAQETFERLWRGAWKPGRARLATWAYRVAVNLCLDRLRRRRFSHDDHGLDMIADQTLGPAMALSVADDARAVRQSLQRLPGTQRAALILKHYHDMSNPDIAACLSISVRAAESLLARAVLSLRRAMEALRK